MILAGKENLCERPGPLPGWRGLFLNPKETHGEVSGGAHQHTQQRYPPGVNGPHHGAGWRWTERAQGRGWRAARVLALPCKHQKHHRSCSQWELKSGISTSQRPPEGCGQWTRWSFGARTGPGQQFPGIKGWRCGGVGGSRALGGLATSDLFSPLLPGPSSLAGSSLQPTPAESELWGGAFRGSLRKGRGPNTGA